MTTTVQPKVNLEDVARKAGVHRATVSRSLRDDPLIPLSTRNRVKEIAKRLGYRMNPLVSALMQTRRTGRPIRRATIAFVTNYPTRYGWRPEFYDRPNFFPGASARAEDFGYTLDHFWLREPGMTTRRFCDILSARGINGIIVGRLPPGQQSLDLEWDRFSCVALGMTLRSPSLHHVTENHFDTVWHSMQRCRELGYHRIGLLYSDSQDSPDVGNRWRSAYLGQQENLASEDRLPICPGNPASKRAFHRWFQEYEPDALLVNNPKLSIDWLKDSGKRVPRDVGVVGIGHRCNFECTGVYYDPAQIGGLAVEMLVGLMHRNETGVPAVPHEVLSSGMWKDTGTLPRRPQRCS